jgi:hypothetical protein
MIIVYGQQVAAPILFYLVINIIMIFGKLQINFQRMCINSFKGKELQNSTALHGQVIQNVLGSDD